MTGVSEGRHVQRNRVGLWLKRLALFLFIATLAWAPFPLGSAVSWGPGIIEILIALCWTIWALANAADLSVFALARRSNWLALGLFGTALVWAAIQSLPIVPFGWEHPLWP